METALKTETGTESFRCLKCNSIMEIKRYMQDTVLVLRCPVCERKVEVAHEG